MAQETCDLQDISNDKLRAEAGILKEMEESGLNVSFTKNDTLPKSAISVLGGSAGSDPMYFFYETPEERDADIKILSKVFTH